MSVEFIDPLQTPGVYIKPSHPGNESRGLIGFLIKRGVVKNEVQANYILLAVAIIFFLITAYMIYGVIKKASVPVQSTAELIEKTQAMERALMTPR